MARWLVPMTGLPKDPFQEFAAAMGLDIESGTDDEWYITSYELESVDARDDAIVIATQLLDVFNGYSTVHWPGMRSHEMSWLLKQEQHVEERVITAVPSLAVLGPPGGDVEDLLWVTDPPQAGYQHKRPRAIAKTFQEQAVRRALSIHGKGGGLWWALYATYEVIRDDMGGWEVVVEREWATKDELDSFRESACHPGISGALARHGTRRSDPRHDAMTLESAQVLLRRLLTLWIGTKADE